MSISCEDTRANLGEYCFGLTPDALHEEMKDHFVHCEHCRDSLVWAQNTIDGMLAQESLLDYLWPAFVSVPEQPDEETLQLGQGRIQFLAEFVIAYLRKKSAVVSDLKLRATCYHDGSIVLSGHAQIPAQHSSGLVESVQH